MPAIKQQSYDTVQQQVYADKVQRFWRGKGYRHVRAWIEERETSWIGADGIKRSMIAVEVCSNLVNGMPPRIGEWR